MIQVDVIIDSEAASSLETGSHDSLITTPVLHASFHALFRSSSINLPNIVVVGLTFLLVFGRYHVQISARKPAILRF
jgi:hypothetical protein